MSFYRKSSSVLFLGLTLFAASCGKKETASTQKYSAWSADTAGSCTIASARQESVHVCMSGQVSEEDLNRSIEWSKRAILTWYRIGKIADQLVTNQIDYTCEDADL